MKGALPGRHLGQLFILKIEDPRWTSSRERLLERIRPAGVVLAVAKLPAAQATAELLGNTAQSLEAKPFLCLEEEGGTVDPLRGCLPALPSARSTAQNGGSSVERLGDLIGAALKLLGFNTNLAPVLDLSTRRSEAILGGRTFSAHAEEVAQCGQAFLLGLRRHGIMPCAKHFPGLAGADSDQSYPAVIGKPMGELWREDLLPYRRLLRHLPMVLVSNAAYKAYDYDLPEPAVTSERVIEGLLRVKLGYDGVVVADLSGGPGTQPFGDPIEAGIRSLRAGCDLLVLREDGASAEALLDRIGGSMESGRVASSRVEQALGRVARLREQLEVRHAKVPNSALDHLARRFEEFGREFAGPTINCGVSRDEQSRSPNK